MTEQNQPKRWAEVVAKPEFQALEPMEREKMRHRYFDEIVAPQTTAANYRQAWEEFDAHSQQVLGQVFGAANPVGSEPEAEGPGLVGNTGRRIADRASDLAGNLGIGIGKAAEAGGDFMADVTGINPGVVWGDGQGLRFTMNMPDEVNDIGDAMQSQGESVRDYDAGYQPNFTWDRLKGDLSVGNLAGYIVEQGGGSIPDMIAAVTMLPAYIATRTEEVAGERATNDGREAPGGRDYAIAAPTAVAMSVLERLGAKGILGEKEVGTAMDLLKETGRAAGKEAGTEFVQEGMEYTATNAGTEAGYDAASMIDRGLAGAVAGGGIGGVGRAATGGAELAGIKQTEQGRQTRAEAARRAAEQADIDFEVKMRQLQEEMRGDFEPNTPRIEGAQAVPQADFYGSTDGTVTAEQQAQREMPPASPEAQPQPQGFGIQREPAQAQQGSLEPQGITFEDWDDANDAITFDESDIEPEIANIAEMAEFAGMVGVPRQAIESALSLNDEQETISALEDMVATAQSEMNQPEVTPDAADTRAESQNPEQAGKPEQALRDQPENRPEAAGIPRAPESGRPENGAETEAEPDAGLTPVPETAAAPVVQPPEQAERPEAPDSTEPEPEQPQTEPVTEPPATVPQVEPLVEHTTRKGKTLRGVVRDISQDEAKAIDPYTFRKDGGFFIREKYLDNAPVPAVAPESPAPSVSIEPNTSTPPKPSSSNTEFEQEIRDKAAGFQGTYGDRSLAPVAQDIADHALTERRRLTGEEIAALSEKHDVPESLINGLTGQPWAWDGIKGLAGVGNKQATEYLSQPKAEPEGKSRAEVVRARAKTRQQSNKGEADIDAAANEAATSPTNDLPEPTAAQKEAGNYRKGHIKVQGLDITIENPKGSQRRGTDPDGNEWSVTMKSHYGDVRGTKGADGDAVDVFVGPNPESDQVFVVDQVNADGTFDEHKALIGWETEQEARDAYAANYDDGWKVGPVTAMSMEEFKGWLESGNTRKPLNEKGKSRADTVREKAKQRAKKKAVEKGAFENNKVFTADAVEKAKARLRAKLGQMNSGLDPETMIDGMTIAGAYVEAGIRDFSQYAKAMIDDLGDGIKPFLLSFWEGARNYPGLDTKGMTSVNDSKAQFDAIQAGEELSVGTAERIVEPDADQSADTEGRQDDTQGTKRNARSRNKTPRTRSVSSDEADPTRDLFGQSDSRVRAEQSGRDGSGDSSGTDSGQTRVSGRSNARDAGNESAQERSGDDRTESGDGTNRRSDDYRIEPGELTRQGSWFDTAERNVSIIELVKTLDAENRKATPEEQALLTKYTGWGASEIANGIFPNQYGQYKTNRWRELGEKLKASLTDEEYAQARRTTQYAHYTSESVIRSIYDGLNRMGFSGGTVLEPGMGVGLFKGLMPAVMASNSQYTGIEYDTMTGKIAGYLYPDSQVMIEDFTKVRLPKEFYDAAIGNPPFSRTKVTNDPEYRKQSFMLHDYFFAKTMDRVKPGGLVVFVTSKGTMDKGTQKARQFMADRANLVGAVRLPQTAFKQNAGTEVVTDVLFFQKRGPGIEDNGVQWLGTKSVSTPQGDTAINEYFADNPDMVLGDNALTGSMYRADEYTVIPREGQDIEQAFAQAVEQLPKGIYRPERGSRQEKAAVLDRDFNPFHKKEGGIYLDEKGNLRQVESGSGVAMETRINATGKEVPLSDKQKAWLKDYVGLRDALKQSQIDQLTDGKWEASLKALNKTYDAFVKRHGRILAHSVSERENANGSVTVTRRFKNSALLDIDVESPLVYAIEEIKTDGSIDKAPALKGRTLKKDKVPQINTTQDALFVSLNQIGRLNIENVAELANISPKEVIEELGDLIYEDPTEGWTMADAYLSGDVVRKLKEARAAAKNNRKLERNVKALEAVQPRKLAPKDITANLGAHWLPPSDIANFAAEVMDTKVEVNYSPIAAAWEASGGRKEPGEWSTSDRSVGQILDSVLNNRQIKITYRDSEGKTYTDDEATENANNVAKKMRDEFKRWIWSDERRTDRLVKFYNEHFNNIVPREFNGDHLTLPGVSTRFSLYSHQKRAIWRGIQEGNTYFAHSVGAGKTFTMIATGMEERRLGLSRKPMYVVPNHMLAQFSNEFLELYPTANIMVADENNFKAIRRRRFMAQAALNDPDAIILTHSAFGMIPVSDDYNDKFINEQIEDLRQVLEESSDDRLTTKKLEQQIEQMESRLRGKSSTEKKDQALDFESMGVDRLFIDEAHEFRKLDFATNRGNIKGIDSTGSKKALDLYMKVSYLEEQNPGRSLVMASGTPVTNTMGELYTVQRFFQKDQLEADGLARFDAWSNHFGEVVDGFEQNAAGGYQIVSRFAKFVNMADLMARVRTFMDVLTSDQLGDLVQRPAVNGGAREIIATPVPDGYKEYQRSLEARIKDIKQRRGPPAPGDDIILNVIADGRFSAIDMRFVDPSLPSDPNSKLNKLLDDVISAYKATAGFEYSTDGKKDENAGSSLMVFTDLGLGEASAQNRGFDMKAWMRQRLVEGGVDPKHIAFMRDNKQHAKKERLFNDMREGKKRILIGGKDMETGVNVQKRLSHLFHLDAPWFPAAVEQREGRIVRQGNQNKEVSVKAYATKGSYDSTMWGMLARKARFIEQAVSGDANMRAMDDVSEASSFEMASALASGDERYLKLAGLRADVDRLHRLYSAHNTEMSRLDSEQRSLRSSLTGHQKTVEQLEKALPKRKPIKSGEFSGTVGKKTFDSREEFSEAIFNEFNDLANSHEAEQKAIASLGGFDVVYTGMTMRGSGDFVASLDVAIPGDPEPLAVFPTDPAMSVTGIATRAVNQVNRLDRQLDETRERIDQVTRRLEQVESRKNAPFAELSELTEKQNELNDLETELAMESEEQGDPVEGAEQADPSIVRQAKTADEKPNPKKTEGISAKEVEEVAERLQEKLPGIVNVVQSMDELPERYRLMRQAGAKHGPRGFFDPETNEVFLIADNIKDPAEAERTYLHEVVGHFGIRLAFGNELNGYLDRLYKQIPTNKLKPFMDRYGLKEHKAADRRVAVEEYIAHTAELNGRKPHWFKRLIARVRDWLRSIGVVRNWTNDDLYALIARSNNPTVDTMLAQSMASLSNLRRQMDSADDNVRLAMTDDGQVTAEEEANSALGLLYGFAYAGHTVYPVNPGATKAETLFQHYGYEGNINADAAANLAGQSAPVTAIIGKTPNSGRANFDFKIVDTDSALPYAVMMPAASARQGVALYQAAMDWAHNNGKKLRPDPAGLSPVNYLRRSEAMLASMMRNGTSRHLEPDYTQFSGFLDESQYTPLARGEYSPETNGLLKQFKARLWGNEGQGSAGEAVARANAHNMAAASLALTLRRKPELLKYRADSQGNLYEAAPNARSKPAKVAGPESALEWIADQITMADVANGVGARTALRAILAQSALLGPNGPRDIAGAISAITDTLALFHKGQVEKMPARPLLPDTVIRRMARAYSNEGSQQPRIYYSLKDPENPRTVDDIINLKHQTPLARAVSWASKQGAGLTSQKYGALTLRQLSEISRVTLPHIKAYVATIHRMMTRRNQMAEDAVTIASDVQKWAARNANEADTLFDLMHEATLTEVDPSEPFVSRKEMLAERVKVLTERIKNVGGEPAQSGRKKRLTDELGDIKKQIKDEPRREINHNRLSPIWEKLSPAAKKHYKTMKAKYEQRHEIFMKLMEARIQNADIEQHVKRQMIAEMRYEFESNTLGGVYFPLARFGDYWVETNDENGERLFTTYESERDQKRVVKELTAANMPVTSGKFLQGSGEVDGVSLGFVQEVMETIDSSNVNEQLSSELGDAVYQLYLQALPTRSMRKNFIHRKGVQGFHRDAIRTFADNMMKGSHQLARLEYQDELSDLMVDMKKAAQKGSNTAADLYNEMVKRHEWVMNPANSTVAQKLTSIGFIWMLGITPAAALVNTTQNLVVALPVLASKFGWAAASKELVKTSGEFLGSIPGAVTDRVKGEKDGRPWSIRNALQGAEREAYDELVDLGVIDVTMAHNLAGIAETDAYRYSDTGHKVMSVVSYLFHKAEVYNRETSGIAAYRLAKASGMEHPKAVQYAADAVWDSHFDYTNTNRARFMQPNWAKVAFQFKQYSQNITYYLVRNAKRAMYDPALGMFGKVADTSKEEQREAAVQLAGTLGITLGLGGITTMPMIGVINSLTNMLLDDDEDEPFDAETEVKQWIVDKVGQDLGERIIWGAGGAGLSSRVTLDGLWVRDPYRDMMGEDLWTHYAQQAMGPVIGGVFVSAFRGVQDISEGRPWTGIEKFLPKAFKDASKAVRYHTEGATTRQGYQLKEDWTFGELALQGLGIADHDLMKRYDANSAIRSYDIAIANRKSALLSQYYQAYSEGDDTLRKETMAAIRRFNEKNPNHKISRASIQSSIRTQVRNSRTNEAGMRMDRGLRSIKDRITYGD